MDLSCCFAWPREGDDGTRINHRMDPDDVGGDDDGASRRNGPETDPIRRKRIETLRMDPSDERRSFDGIVVAVVVGVEPVDWDEVRLLRIGRISVFYPHHSTLHKPRQFL